jgi:predicted kinase
MSVPVTHYERMFYPADMAALNHERRRAMAQALHRAAEHFEVRAQAIDQQVARWRKGRPGDSSPIVAQTLHGVARELRVWADRCCPHTKR